MRPAVGTLAATPYTCGTPLMAPGTTARQEHHMYTTTGARVNIALQPDTLNRTRIVGTKHVGGNAICLPYDVNKISSVRLPYPCSGLGIDFFYTANMSGCKFYVDREGTSQNLVVYHANSRQPGTGLNGLPADQAAGVTNALDTLHTSARNDYQPTTLNAVTSLGKPQYNAAANPLVMIKRGRVATRQRSGRMDIKDRVVSFTGGTTIVGYPGNHGWEFYYQTWGYVEYTRPSGFSNVMAGLFTGHWKYLHKLRTRGTKEQIGNMAVIANAQF